MRKLKNLTLRQLTLLMSVLVVLLFLMFYFTFKAFWSFDQQVTAVTERQKNEIERVEILLSMAERELQTSLEDYAAWDSMIEFTQNPTKEFIRDNIGPHAFESKLIDGIVILDTDMRPIWSGQYQNNHVYDVNFLDMPRRSESNALLGHSLLSNAKALPSNHITSAVEYTVFQNRPYLISYAKLCKSTGYDCQYGYLFFIRQIEPQFISDVEQATGVGITMRTFFDTDLQTAPPNHSFIYKKDALDQDILAIDISHPEKIPEFLTIPEIYALSSFAMIMLLFNVGIVTFMIRPINRAQRALTVFEQTGGKLPCENSFYSKEMRSFARYINKLISELEDKSEKLKWQSFHDPLTGLANRRGLYESLENYISQQQYQYVAIVLLDIDHFKQFNDNYGHMSGDEALKKLSKALADDDIAMEKIACRYGGEEFCLVFFNDFPINIEKQLHIIQRKVSELKIRHGYSPVSEQLTVSIGATTQIVEDYRDIAPMFQRADEGLYEAKNSGKSQYRIR